MDTVDEGTEVRWCIIRQPQNPADLIRPLTDSSVDASLPTSDLSETLRVLELDFVSPQSFFNQLLLGYVNARADKSDEITSTVERSPVVQNPAVFSVGAS